MCGIIGKIGESNVTPDLIEGLKKLEYRGYDSAGIAVETEDGIKRLRAMGKISNLEQRLDDTPLAGFAGIGHTRWATHGEPAQRNAHPHKSPCGKFTVVHNGIIENAGEIKRTLLPADSVFTSETDTEVVAHLLTKYYTGDPVAALSKTIAALKGSYALGILCADFPKTVFAAAFGSPLIAAKGKDGMYISSDAGAVAAQAETIYKVENRQIAVLTETEIRFYDENGAAIEKAPVTLNVDALQMDKGGYEHYMLYEIMQQPAAVRQTILPLIKDGKIVPEGSGLDESFIRNDLREIVIVACGSAYHTGLAAKCLFETYARVPCRAEIASEFRYADPVIDEHTLTVFVSQSGETADTLAALRLSKEKGAKVLSIVNVAGSAIATESDGVIYTKAGREIAVATTKAYSAQLSVFYALAIFVAALKGKITGEEEKALVHALASLPDKIQETIDKTEEAAKALATKIYSRGDMFFIGRQLDNAAATEASLKMKEISYLNSQAYAAGELKHGTISLVEPGTPVIAIAAEPAIAAKTHSNVCEVKARGAFTVAVTTEKQAPVFADSDLVITVPDVHDWFTCSLTVVPMQLLSYYTAKNRGCDIDKPKNLAKSVTVE